MGDVMENFLEEKRVLGFGEGTKVGLIVIVVGMASIKELCLSSVFTFQRHNEHKF